MQLTHQQTHQDTHVLTHIKMQLQHTNTHIKIQLQTHQHAVTKWVTAKYGQLDTNWVEPLVTLYLTHSNNILACIFWLANGR